MKNKLHVLIRRVGWLIALPAFVCINPSFATSQDVEDLSGNFKTTIKNFEEYVEALEQQIPVLQSQNEQLRRSLTIAKQQRQSQRRAARVAQQQKIKKQIASERAAATTRGEHFIETFSTIGPPPSNQIDDRR